MVVTVEDMELFLCAMRLSEIMKRKAVEGTLAVQSSSMSEYIKARNDYDDMKKILDSPIFSSWSSQKNVQFPLWIEIGKKGDDADEMRPL